MKIVEREEVRGKSKREEVREFIVCHRVRICDSRCRLSNLPSA
jgi:hypothetical protein